MVMVWAGHGQRERAVALSLALGGILFVSAAMPAVEAEVQAMPPSTSPLELAPELPMVCAVEHWPPLNPVCIRNGTSQRVRIVGEFSNGRRSPHAVATQEGPLRGWSGP
jgi:hypothetical protein